MRWTFLWLALATAGAGGVQARMNAQYLRCEYLENPAAVDVPAPRLSWEVASNRRADLQTAYRVVVASSEDRLNADSGDLWDSGRVASDETAHIAYAGKPLQSSQPVWWKVMVWDRDGKASAWSAPARWTAGLLRPSDWTAKWVSAPEPPEPAEAPARVLRGLSWVWAAGVDAVREAPRGNLYFRRGLTLPEGKTVASAVFTLTVDDNFELFVNGHLAGRSSESMDAWKQPVVANVAAYLRPGVNTLAVAARNSGSAAGAVGVLVVRLDDGETMTVPLDAAWKTSAEEEPDWTRGDFDDAHWTPAVAVANVGDAPWGAVDRGPGLSLPPSPFMRKDFRAAGPVRRAVLYVTALGLYEPYLNGRRVGDDVFAPGWTDYRKRVYYRAYDVTGLVRNGDNTLGAVLGDGWACGYVGLGGRDRYSIGRPRLLAQLRLEYADGRTETVATDNTWTAAYGAIREADMLMGETYDSRLEMDGWAEPGFEGGAWNAVEEREEWPALLEAYPGVPVRKIKELRPIDVTEPRPGVYVLDMGQNMVGWVRLRVNGMAGQAVALRFAEVLNADGTMYTTNLRGARNVDTYTLKGGGPETWEPRFTFHGFRYVEVTGLDRKPQPDDITGVVVHSDTPLVGRFSSSHATLNQLQHNIEWGQRGNFLEVPTDCPQRDERLGWMGDAQVFIRAAVNNMDVAAFFTKWLVDVEDAMRGDAFTDVAPDVCCGAGTAAWAEAGVICPWVVYQVYGDKRVLERHYNAMARYIGYLERNSNNLLRPAEGYGDWLSIGADTPRDVIGTAYFAYATSLVANAAEALGKTEDAAKYRALFGRVKDAFNAAYVRPDGRIHGDTQTCYVMALQMDLVPAEMRPVVAQHLVDDIRRKNDHLSTGFVGTSYLNPVLSRAGHTETAYRLLFQDTFPGWFFSIKHGATTIWERWDGWTPDKGFQDPGMNSFNHYSFGAVGQWMFGTVAGIDQEAPGFRKIRIRPEPNERLTHAEATYRSIRGDIHSAWKREDGRFTLDVTVPANTAATVYVPARHSGQVLESGKPPANGVTFLRMDPAGYAVYEVGSGSYRFTAG